MKMDVIRHFEIINVGDSFEIWINGKLMDTEDVQQLDITMEGGIVSIKSRSQKYYGLR